MLSIPLSSGDAIVDRRLQWADALLAEGDAPGAAALLAEVMDHQPLWAAGWYRLGEFHEAAGNPLAALLAFERAVRADPADHLGAGLRCRLLRQSPRGSMLRPLAPDAETAPETMPSAFVETLFDAYAPGFDDSLERLGYRGPDLVAEAVARGGPVQRALDIGCGTGLLGVRLRPLVRRLEGIDISAEMLARAERRGIYDRLEKADLNLLPPAAPGYDLIAAADVVMYIGALDRLAAWVAGALLPGGRFVFTAEMHPGEGFVLGEARRYRHSAAYLSRVLEAAGFATPDLAPARIRRDREAWVEALVIRAELAASRPNQTKGDGAGDGGLAVA